MTPGVASSIELGFFIFVEHQEQKEHREHRKQQGNQEQNPRTDKPTDKLITAENHK